MKKACSVKRKQAKSLLSQPLSIYFPQGYFLSKIEEVLFCLDRFVMNKHASLQRRVLYQVALKKKIALPLCSSFPKALALLKPQILVEINMESGGKDTLCQIDSSPNYSQFSRHIHWIAWLDTRKMNRAVARGHWAVQGQ